MQAMGCRICAWGNLMGLPPALLGQQLFIPFQFLDTEKRKPTNCPCHPTKIIREKNVSRIQLFVIFYYIFSSHLNTVSCNSVLQM